MGPGVGSIQLGFSVQRFRFDEALTAPRVDAPPPPARLKRRKYISSALPPVDETGFDPMTRAGARSSGSSVTAAAAARSPSVSNAGRLDGSLIPANKSIRDRTELLAGDEALAAALLDRLLRRARVLNIKGRSYRLRDLEEALKG